MTAAAIVLPHVPTGRLLNLADLVAAVGLPRVPPGILVQQQTRNAGRRAAQIALSPSSSLR